MFTTCNANDEFKTNNRSVIIQSIVLFKNCIA